MAPRRRDLGELSPRLLELSAKTSPVEPYTVTDKVTILPLTKKRRAQLHDAHNTIAACQAKLSALLKSAEQPKPEHPGEDATSEERDAYEAALAKWNQTLAAMEQQSNQIAADANSATEQYNRALFGDAHDDITALSDDWDAELWDAFIADVQSHFLSGVNPPPDGTDESGAVVDEEEAGKAQ